MITVDASLLIAHFSSSDVHHETARTFITGADELLAHTVTVAEVLVGAVRVGRGEAMLLDLERIGLELRNRHFGSPLRLATLRVRTGLKLPDCCVLDTALTSATPLATLDNALATAARQLGVSVLT